MCATKLVLRISLLLLFVLPFSSEAYAAATLRGSPSSMQRQHSVAENEGYEFVKTPEDVQKLVDAGRLVHMPGNAHYTVLESVSFPYARPELRLFIERLAEQYHEGTGERLVVTSLTRPTNDQPWNAHPLSVHPAGLAVDLRISRTSHSRQWLESVLLKLEKQNLLDGTRERNPPHYHIALFPGAYRDHVEELIGAEQLAAALDFPKPDSGEKSPDTDLADRVVTRTDTVLVQTGAATVPPGPWRSFDALHVLLAAIGGFGIGIWYAGRKS